MRSPVQHGPPAFPVIPRLSLLVLSTSRDRGLLRVLVLQISLVRKHGLRFNVYNSFKGQ